MSIMSQVVHQAIKTFCHSSYRSFIKSLQSPQETQLAVLKETLNFLQLDQQSLSAFKKKYPLSTYQDWKKSIEDHRQEKSSFAGEVERFEPTSGSSENMKWIPFTKLYLKQLDRASSPWLYDLYHRYQIDRGVHYWSLSWMPDSLRQEMNNHDLDYLPWWKRPIYSKIMAVEPETSFLPTAREAQLSTLASLLNKPTSFISVWSPTFLLRLLEILEQERSYLSRLIHQKESRNVLLASQQLGPQELKILFPKLKLISSWDTASSQSWAQKIQELFPFCAFQGKGLWATEGVVTIPFQGHFPLAIRSHFYEFECLDSGKLYNSWELKAGMDVKPYLTSATGLLRYQLNDHLYVQEKLFNTPCIQFKGRLGTTDLAGEKISQSIASEINTNLTHLVSGKVITLCAVQSTPKPYYMCLVEGKKDESIVLDHILEEKLMSSHHYKLARDLGQIDHAQCKYVDNGLEEYYKLRQEKVVVSGNVKIEPLIQITIS